MNLDELKVIWDSQKKEPLYTLDREAVHKGVKREGKTIQFCLNMFEIMSLVILFGLGIAVGSEPLFEGHDFHQYLDAAIYFTVGTYLAVEFRRRKRAEQQFGDSMIGDLDRAIFQLDVQLRRYRVFPWIVLGPMIALAVIKLPMHTDSKPLWLAPMAILCLVGTIWTLRYEAEQKLKPGLKALQNLRAKLVDPTE
jgi:hypothetical protein